MTTQNWLAENHEQQWQCAKAAAAAVARDDTQGFAVWGFCLTSLKLDALDIDLALAPPTWGAKP